MVAGFKSECRPASSRNTWPECIGICSLRGYNQLPKVIQGVKFTDGIEVVRSQAQAAA
jgi:hypothetical protein